MSWVAAWFSNYQFVAIWLEAVALVAIFLLDWREYKKQGYERLKHEEDLRKQHEETDRTFGPDRGYSDLSVEGGRIFPEYLGLQEAFYLSYLVSAPLAAFMKERMADADGLQQIRDPNEFHEKLQEFNQRWDVYKMAESIRELS